MENQTDNATKLAAQEVGETSYDRIPYTESSFPQLDPANLGVIGRLSGGQPVDPQQCRVLELGCGHGVSMVALAQKYPNSEFVGIDLSRRQIENGTNMATAAGLKNVKLETLSIDDPAVNELGEFDYVVCHGVFSWVPPAVQDAILEICGRQLTANGLAYISFNSLPGWNSMLGFRQIALDMAARREQPEQKVKLAAGFMATMADLLEKAEKRPDRIMTQRMAQRFRRGPASYLLHEYMEENNQPCYFREFIERANTHGLEYAGENGLRLNFPLLAAGKRAGDVIRRLARDRIDAHQLLDYFMNTQFHSSILARNGALGERQPFEKLLESCALSHNYTLPAGLTLAEGVEQQFGSGGNEIRPKSALMKAMLAEICDERAPIHWPELGTRARQRLAEHNIKMPADSDSEQAQRDVAVSFQRLAFSARVALTIPVLGALRPATKLPAKPVATRLARSLTADNKQPVNLRLSRRPVTPLTMWLLPRCDGTRTIEQLVAEASDATMRGELEAPKQGPDKPPLKSREEIQKNYLRHFDHLLDRYFFVHEDAAADHLG